MNKLMQTVTENVAYVVIFLAVIVGCFLVAVVLEKSAQKKNGVSEPIFNTRKLAMIGMFSAIAMILKLCIKGTSTAFIGDLANFVVGCSLIIPASAVYSFKKTKKNAILACIAGTLVMTIFGTAFNAVYLLPAFSKFYGMPLDAILAMGTEVNPLAKEGSIVSFVVACVAPMNLIKGTLVSVVTLLIYKPLSPIIKTGHKA